MRLLPLAVNRALAHVLIVTLFLTSLPMRAVAAVPCSPQAAIKGTDPACGAMIIGGTPVAYPKLAWNKLTELPVTSPQTGETSLKEGSHATLLASRAAKALAPDLSARDFALMVSAIPSNMPMVIGRYNPTDKTLRVDVFKVVKSLTGNGSGPSAGLYHAQFTPAHGDMWRAARAYIHPDAFKAGMTPGVNPFDGYMQGSSNLFHDISVEGGKVAVGHAMRLAGTAVGVLVVSNARLSVRQEDDGGWFVKTVTTIYTGHVKPLWLVALPPRFVTSYMQKVGVAAVCVDPTVKSCPGYQVASSGVAFEQFEGGSLSDHEDEWEVDRDEQSGLGFLGALLVAVIASFALMAVAAEIGLVAAAAEGPALGSFGNMLATSGLLESASISQLMAIGIEVAGQALTMAVISGANMTSIINVNAGLLLGFISVSQGRAELNQSDLERKLNVKLSPLMTGDLVSAPLLTGVQSTLIGNCPAGSSLSSCNPAGTGVLPHADQYAEQDLSGFLRDNDGRLVRSDVAELPGS